MVVHFPIALWITSGLFDALFLLRRNPAYAQTARWLVGLGLLGAAVAIALGFVDLTRQVALGVGTGIVIKHRLHSALAYAATAIYLASFIGRRRGSIPAWIYPLTVAGAVLIGITGWIGGELRRVM